MTHLPTVDRGLWLLALVGAALWGAPAVAQVDLVTIDAPDKQVWVGQQAALFVKLRAPGSFVGAAEFSIPQVPRTVIVKIGDAVVSSEEVEGESWFVQTHEFALFSQADGKVELPAFEVRFSNRKGFTGPAFDHKEKAPAVTFEVKRPPDSDNIGFLVTTEKIDVQETWDPQPGDAKQGDVYHRTIVQEAQQVTGMALAPPPSKAPDGVRVYAAQPIVTDDNDRGDFTGKRSDTLTYMLQQPGALTFPAIKYVWWNPESEAFGSVTLPAVTLHVAAAPPPPQADAPQATGYQWIAWLLPVAMACALAIWQRDHLVTALARLGRWLNPPERVAAPKLLRACRRDDAVWAEAAWLQWQSLQDPAPHASPRLVHAATGLQRRLYGPADEAPWRGDELASAFREERSRRAAAGRPHASFLAPMNPR